MEQEEKIGLKRVMLTIFNLILFLLGLCAAAALLLGMKNTDKEGTFSIAGYSLYLNKSPNVSEKIAKNDLVVIKRCDATSYRIGDVVAFFYDYNGESKLTLKTFSGVSEESLLLTDKAGEEYYLSAENTNFVGVVVKNSAFLGNAVRFLQTDDGKVMFLWWCIGIALFIIGVNLLLHVIFKERQPKEDESSDEIPLDIDD